MRTLLLFLFALLIAPVALQAQSNQPGVALGIQPAIPGHFCLDARGGRDQDGVPVVIHNCHPTESERWTVTSSANNQHAIIGLDAFCLDVRGVNNTANGTPAQLWKCHFGDNQRFSLQSDGRIREVRSGKCLIATKPADDAPVVLDTCKKHPGRSLELPPLMPSQP